jgi:hypothetical protein
MTMGRNGKRAKWECYLGEMGKGEVGKGEMGRHPSFSAIREKYSNHYCLSMQTTSSQSCDINWLFFGTGR